MKFNKIESSHKEDKGRVCGPLFLLEGVTEVGVDRVIHVVLTKRGFLKLKTEAKIIANFGVETNIHEHTTVFFTFDTFLTGGITQYGFTPGMSRSV